MRAMQGTCTMLGLSLSPGPWPRCSWLQCQVDQVFVFFLMFPWPWSPGCSCPGMWNRSPSSCQMVRSRPVPPGWRALRYIYPAGIPATPVSGHKMNGVWGLGTGATRCPASFSLSLFSSQELKFNYISKEINFNVTLPMPV